MFVRLAFELRALVCGLWRAGLAVRIAGATSVQSAGTAARPLRTTGQQLLTFNGDGSQDYGYGYQHGGTNYKCPSCGKGKGRQEGIGQV